MTESSTSKSMLQICVIKQVRKFKHFHIQVFPYMAVIQRKLLMNAYFLSQFGYYPLVWVNYSRVIILFILLSSLFIVDWNYYILS